MEQKVWTPETTCVKGGSGEAGMRGGRAPKPLVTPVYASSTFVLSCAEEGASLSSSFSEDGYIYSRWGNPTVDAAAEAIAQLEGAAGTLLFPSGMSAITTSFLTFANAGDHIVVPNVCYGGAHCFLHEILVRFGVEVSFIDSSSVDGYKKAIKENTKILYAESPMNPLMSVIDLEAFGALGKSLPGVLTMVDVTFASPYLIQPLLYGIDVSIHSCTKYIGGHSDIVGGSVSYATKELGKTLHHTQLHLGCNMSPFDAFLVHRSLKTLPIRMERHSASALAVAEFLEQHPKVKCVYYPGLPSHRDHEVAKRTMKLFSGMMSFELKGGLDDGKKLAESTKIAVLAVSLGGAETLIEHPASMTHADNIMSAEMKKAGGITPGLMRLSVGLEDSGDIIRDLQQALEKV